jgi:hypothetical protein
METGLAASPLRPFQLCLSKWFWFMIVYRVTIMISMLQMQIFKGGKVIRLGFLGIIPDYIGLLIRDRSKPRKLTGRVKIGINSILRAAHRNNGFLISRGSSCHRMSRDRLKRQ